ncbi:MAG: bifunctional DNA-formamidopyrimidine glycosylase/DNA-(apurinic or apyrimidinic site) lyase [Deltaproteobacteria bacterium]|nr:bifunctional DNA-formamidopyrimidine glycosylase/DNA-(apurinic or apyrimidinic site) lyase [Deltaproteobacteria bacterium]
MPELPEVEVTRRKLAPSLVGRRIAKVHTTRASYFFLTPPARLARELPGAKLVGLERIGKYLLVGLDDGRRLLLHLGMSGQLVTAGASSVRLLSASKRASLAPEEQTRFRPDAHTHLRLEFDDGGPELLFRDVRKFGKVRLLEKGASDPRLDRLGVDALDVTGARLFEATRGRRVAVKSVLLAQDVIAGVGNIYADEALFAAGIRPRRPAGRLTRIECDALARAIRKVLLRSIETGGSSISDYLAPDGADGAYQDERRVYARGGEPCLVCGTPIRRVVICARSSHYCPRCQR